MSLSLAPVLTVLNSLAAEIRAAGEPAVAMVVCCPSCEPLALIRMDGVPGRIARFAEMKAYSAAYREASTLSFRNFLQQEQLELASFGNPRLTNLPGGFPIVSNGVFLGAVGVSGRMPMDDHALSEQIAKALAEACA